MKVVIIGAGKLGYKIAESLVNNDIETTVIDLNQNVVNRIREYLDVLAITANGIDISALRSLNLKSYDFLIATTSSDETNSIICSLAKKEGCKKTIARIRNPEYSQQIDFLKNEMKINHIVNPELSTAKEISRYLLKNYTFYSDSFALGRVSMIDCNANYLEGFIGKKLKDLNYVDDLLIAAISRNNNVMIPNGDTEILKEDILYIIGKSTIINKIGEKKLNVGKTLTKKAMILGGGKIGYYLAQRLLAAHIHVTMVESDNNRCRYLSENLHNALIIHGDGTNIDLLEEENLSLMDAFIGTTGYDEQNLLMALFAKQIGVKKVIAKISRKNYIPIIDKLNIDVALNPTEIISSDIIRFIRGGKIISISLLLGGQAEVIEIIVTEDLSICNRRIKELGLPKGIVIGAVVDKDRVIIPNGQTVIKKDNRLIFFCMTYDIPKLNVLIKPHKRRLFR